MGVFDWIKSKNPRVVTKGYFKVLDGYVPIYTSFSGGIYEALQTRSVINAIATDCSKSIPELRKHNKEIEYMLKHRPNPFMSTSNFIERIVTCLLVDNNAFILPILDEFGRVRGLFPVGNSQVELLEYNNEPYLRYKFLNGQTAVIEYSKVGHLKRMFYKSDVFGESNRVLFPTLEIINSQDQAITEALKNSGSVRFSAQLTNQLDDEDIEEERQLFSERNFKSENGQMMIFDSRYKDIKQMESKAVYLDDKQAAMIDGNVQAYYGVSKKVINHEFTNDYEWNSYYEGVLEPILIKLGEEVTKILYTAAQVKAGNEVYFTANRLQYMSNESKLQFCTQLFDRGNINGDMVCDVWNLPHYEGGDKRYIRKEYAQINKLDDSIQLKNQGKDEEDESKGKDGTEA